MARRTGDLSQRASGETRREPEHPTAESARSRRGYKTLLKVGISGALLVWLITQIDLTRTLTVLAHARKAGYLVALALFIVSVPIRAYRWKILAEGLGLDVPIKKLTEFYFVGTFFNGVLPTGFGGDAIRAADLAHHTGRAGESLGTVLIDRFLGIIVLLAIGVGTLAFAGRPFERRLAWSLTIVLAIAVVGFWLLRRRKLLTRLARVVPPAPRRLLESPVRALYTGLQGYPSGVLVRASLVSLVFNALWIGVNVLLGWSLGIDASIYHYLLFVPVVSLSLVIPSVGGLGVRELTYVGLFGLIGVARGTAFALGIMVYAVTVATGLIGGLILLANASREYLPLRDH